MAEMERSLLEVIDAALEEIRPMSTKRARDIAEVLPIGGCRRARNDRMLSAEWPLGSQPRTPEFAAACHSRTTAS